MRKPAQQGDAQCVKTVSGGPGLGHSRALNLVCVPTKPSPDLGVSLGDQRGGVVATPKERLLLWKEPGNIQGYRFLILLKPTGPFPTDVFLS